jgi:hypothetical protein
VDDGVVSPPITASNEEAVPMIPSQSALSTRFDSYDDDMIAFLSTLDKQEGLADAFVNDDAIVIPDVALSLGGGIPYDDIAAVPIPSMDAFAELDTTMPAGALEGALADPGDSADGAENS